MLKVEFGIVHRIFSHQLHKPVPTMHLWPIGSQITVKTRRISTPTLDLQLSVLCWITVETEAKGKQYIDPLFIYGFEVVFILSFCINPKHSIKCYLFPCLPPFPSPHPSLLFLVSFPPSLSAMEQFNGRTKVSHSGQCPQLSQSQKVREFMRDCAGLEGSLRIVEICVILHFQRMREGWWLTL